MLRNLAIRDREKGLSAGEKRMITKARQILISELAFATGMAVKPVLAAEADLDRAIARLLDGVELRPRPAGFAWREDAIELPEDTSPLAPLRAARGLKGGFGDGEPN